VKAPRVCFPTAIRSSAGNSKKIFHINRKLAAAIFYFGQPHQLDKMKDRSEAAFAFRLSASADKQDDISFAEV
jgi:hypothetical protein